jgi:hypothetical protein
MSAPPRPLLPSTPVRPADGDGGLPGVDVPDGVGPIRLNEPGSFAWNVFHQRHRLLVADLQATHAYDQAQRRELDTLVEESTTSVVAPLPADAHDQEAWSIWGREEYGAPWSGAPFLWAESYFHRRLLQAIGFYAPGPWFWIDPFEPRKTSELSATTIRAASDELEDLLLMATWGNRADLGFRITHDITTTEPGALIIDDRDAVLAASEQRDQRVAVVADNAGEELVADLALIDHLLTTGVAGHIDLHIKPVPYYVSDAVASDVWSALRALARGPATTALADRLTRALTSARLELVPHWFHTSPLSYHHLPDDLVTQLGSCSMVLFKGDLNYRRLVGDYDWPATARFADTVAYLPDNVVALRTLKSDVIVGLGHEAVHHLDRSGADWRTSGTHAVIQANLRPGTTGS